MAFPADFPSTGVWQIKFYDDNEEPNTKYAQHVFCTEYLDDYYLMRRKTENGWDFRMAEQRYQLVQLQNGNWTMGTWMSAIVIIEAKKVN
tara:strand:+ start:823 stop:1092 length:270 start_codon:yes stop_codon:yes gene_type:complete